MNTPRLVILRDKPTAGKSTTFKTFKKDRRLRNLIFVDFHSIKNRFDYLSDEQRKKLGKEVLFSVLKNIMPAKRDILIEEMSRDTIQINIKEEIKKGGYVIVVFQFEVSLETAKIRNVVRAKEKTHPLMNAKQLERLHEMHEEKFDKKGILVDTNLIDKKQVVEFIVNKLVHDGRKV